jgi:hypothetical protein
MSVDCAAMNRRDHARYARGTKRERKPNESRLCGNSPQCRKYIQWNHESLSTRQSIRERIRTSICRRRPATRPSPTAAYKFRVDPPIESKTASN